MAYDLSQFEADIAKVKPRAFDTYILPAFLVFYAIKSKREMGRMARRALFTAGIYMVYRNWAEYRAAYNDLSGRLKAESPEAGNAP